MHMGSTDMSGMKSPAAVVAHLLYRLQYDFPLSRRQRVWSVVKACSLDESTFGIRIGKPASICMVKPIDRSLLVAMEVISVTGEGNEISHDACNSVS